MYIRESCGPPSVKDNPIKLYENNVAYITQIKCGFIKYDRTKYIFPKFFYTHKLQDNTKIDVQEIKSCDNLLYLFTKALPLTTLKKIKIQYWNTEIKRSTSQTIEENIIISIRGGEY